MAFSFSCASHHELCTIGPSLQEKEEERRTTELSIDHIAFEAVQTMQATATQLAHFLLIG
jgi:hypothetical protein